MQIPKYGLIEVFGHTYFEPNHKGEIVDYTLGWYSRVYKNDDVRPLTLQYLPRNTGVIADLDVFFTGLLRGNPKAAANFLKEVEEHEMNKCNTKMLLLYSSPQESTYKMSKFFTESGYQHICEKINTTGNTVFLMFKRLRAELNENDPPVVYFHNDQQLAIVRQAQIRFCCGAYAYKDATTLEKDLRNQFNKILILCSYDAAHQGPYLANLYKKTSHSLGYDLCVIV